MFVGTKDPIIRFGLMDQSGSIHDDVKNVLLSAVQNVL